jgi:hypothetical protein
VTECLTLLNTTKPASREPRLASMSYTFETSKLHAPARWYAVSPFTTSKSPLICNELPVQRDRIRIADPHASRVGSGQCSEEEFNESK